MSCCARRLRFRRGPARRSAFAVLLAVVAIFAHAGRAHAHEFADDLAAALGRAARSVSDGVADRVLDAAAAGAQADAADRDETLTLSALGGEATALLLAEASRSIEPLLEREGPGARFRPRGVRTACRAAPTRISPEPEALRCRHLSLTYRTYQEVLVAASAGMLSSFSTALPPPSQPF